MTAANIYPSIEMALNARYRGHEDRDWDEWHDRHLYERAADIPPDAGKALIRRQKGNVAGLGDRAALNHLIAGNVDQPMLEDISRLPRLERLELTWPTMAEDLTPLARLTNLKFLSIDSPRKAKDFAFLAAMPQLRTLMIENAKHLSDIEWLAGAHHLEVIGIEGAMDSKQTIASLKPLAGLTGLRAFLGTSLRLIDADLMPLASCPSLHFLGLARLAKKPAFDALREARPDIVCAWFNDGAWRNAGVRPS